MLKPPTPVDELLRLETLRNLKILDTDPEERFDRVTRLARRIFGTPIALVSLVDSDRQWFKSRQGLDAEQTPRDVSFCGHAILNDDVMVVEDAHDDARFADNPLVMSDPSIRFYAGYPLNAPDGSKVGTLCIIDREPREMPDEDIALLQELGEMIEEELVAAEMMRNDAVTGLSNRGGFAMIAEHVLAMCARSKLPASLMLFHLTNYDCIDGAMGSEESDRAAIEMTQLLMATFRDSDIVGRIGEDTFAVLLAGAALDDVDNPAERFIARIKERNGRNAQYELEVQSYAVNYDYDSHKDVEGFIQAVETLTSVIDVAESANNPVAADFKSA